MKHKSYITLAVVMIVILIVVFSTSFSQSQPKRYVVKLYSADRVVGTWEANDWATIDGETITFNVGNRRNPTRVRINGTYSIEEFD